MRIVKILVVYLAFVFTVAGIGVSLPNSNEGAVLGGLIAAFGLTYFWFQFRPIGRSN
jgi:hypothetical protein